MAVGWLGYDVARVQTLSRRTLAAADELAELAELADLADLADLAGLASGETPADVVTTVLSIVDSLRVVCLALLGRVALDTTLISWSTWAIPAGELPEPPEGSAHLVAHWWNDLTESERHALIVACPAVVGNLDGVPAWARDLANRRRLATDLDRLAAVAAAGELTDAQAAALATARAVEAALVDGGTFVDPRTGAAAGTQLYLYDPAANDGDGRVAIALGDLDAAEHVAVAVPGMGTEASRIATRVPRVVFAAAATHTTDSVAVMTWHGYDAPSIAVPDGDRDSAVDVAADWIAELGDLATVVTMAKATNGGAALASDVSGLRAMRRGDVHVTVIGNSYGSTTVAIAADEFELAADDVVLTGSPGAGRAEHASDLTTGSGHTWVGSASDDPVSYLGHTGGVEPHDVIDLGAGDVGLGNDPVEDDFGAQRFQAEWRGRDGASPWSLDGHGQYFDPCAEGPGNIGAIVAGEYDAVRLAEHRHKDESWDVWDPLGDLLPADPEAHETVDVDRC